jgi:FHS family L-fucose permease-like MFS transporter
MKHAKLTTKENLIPFILITVLFFLWGMAHGMLDVLNAHFQSVLHITKAESGLIQFSVYMAYFSMALPAGYFMRRFGYKKGIILGLLLFATGAYLIVPASIAQSYNMFLIGLFVLGCGLATIETAANPYTTKLGPKETAERRINFSQSFNGLAWIFGPIFATFFILGGNESGTESSNLNSMIAPYAGIGSVVLVIAIIYIFVKLPEITEEDFDSAHGFASEKKEAPVKSLFKTKHLVFGVIAQFCYVAAQTGIFSFFVNYLTDEKLNLGITKEMAGYLLGLGGMSLFFVGRLSGSWIMRYIEPTKLLAIYALMCLMMLPVVSGGFGIVSVIALFATFFFMSIMFPTIFALAIKDLGEKTKKGSSFIIMSIVGGAVFPALMGRVADLWSMSVGFLVPIPLFAFILFYALKGHKVIR